MNNAPSTRRSALGGAPSNPRSPVPSPQGGGQRRLGTEFYLTHAWIPLIAFVALVVVAMGFNGDLWVADRIYAWEGHRWALRGAYLTDDIIHRYGRTFSAMAWLGVLAAWVVARTRSGWAHLRMPLVYVLVAVAVSTALVAWVKSWSNMDCPWDLLRYGGERPYVGLLRMRPLGLDRGACFPAGHASGGYAWVCLYFFLWAVKPRWRGWGLAAGLALGLTFGISQQLRGAHFLSHDVWTAAICWTSALALFIVFRSRMAEQPVPADEPVGAAMSWVGR